MIFLIFACLSLAVVVSLIADAASVQLSNRSRYAPSGGYKPGGLGTPGDTMIHLETRPSRLLSEDDKIIANSKPLQQPIMKRISYAPSANYWSVPAAKKLEENVYKRVLLMSTEEQVQEKLEVEEVNGSLQKSKVELTDSNKGTLEEKGLLVPPASSTLSLSSSTTTKSSPSTSIVKRTPLPSIYETTVSEFITDLALRDSDQVADAISKGLKGTMVALVRAFLCVVNAGTQFTLSSEISEVGKSLSLAGLAASKTVEETTKTISEVQTSWKRSVGDVPIETGETSEYVNRIVKGISSVTSSPEVRKSIAKVGENASKTGTELVSSVNITSNKLTKDLGQSKPFREAISDLKGYAGLLIASIFVAAKKVTRKD